MEPIKKSSHVRGSKHRERSPAQNRSPKSSRIGLRTSPAQEKLIRLAAEVKEKSLSEFILDTAYQAAEQTLLEQRLFIVSEDKFVQFSALLDRPTMDNEGLKKLFSRPDPWDE